MKKKIAIVLTLALVVTAISVSSVFAKDIEVDQGEKQAIKSMFDAMRSWSQQAQDSGEITKEEAKEWDKHFKDMEKFHEEDGFGGMMGSGTYGGGMMGNGNYGSGMMGSYSRGIVK